MASGRSSGAETSAPARLIMSPAAARALVMTAVGAGSVAGFFATESAVAAQAAAHAGDDLTRLLRAMAAIKAAMAMAALAGVLWRLGSPVTVPWLAAYAATGAVMAAGPGLIWNMADVALGALLLHAGLLSAVILLWRDPAVGRRIAAIIAARRTAG
jgi:hypothetical protein